MVLKFEAVAEKTAKYSTRGLLFMPHPIVI